MIKSMTGYGKAEALLETGKITVEVRSLNGKTADISIKTSMLPKDKEMAVRQKIAAELPVETSISSLPSNPMQQTAQRRSTWILRWNIISRSACWATGSVQ